MAVAVVAAAAQAIEAVWEAAGVSAAVVDAAVASRTVLVVVGVVPIGIAVRRVPAASSLGSVVLVVI